MSVKYIITGTDTDIGKTVFAAALTQALNAVYWKPIQSGIEGMVDTRLVQQLTGLPNEHFLPESYLLTEPLSPHLSSEIDNDPIDVDGLKLPESEEPLIVEGAGGLMVPLTRKNLLINKFKEWNVPVILCARTGLGTINHTLLSLEALWARKIPVHGVVFIGEENHDNIRTIIEFSGEKLLGYLPWISDLTPVTLKKAFAENFNLKDFLS